MNNIDTDMIEFILGFGVAFIFGFFFCILFMHYYFDRQYSIIKWYLDSKFDDLRKELKEHKYEIKRR